MRPVAAAVLVALAVSGLAYFYGTHPVVHQYFELDQSSAVETWSVPLPLGYRVERWKSQPEGPMDGFRLFPPN